MDFAAKNIGFVVAAYALSLVVIAGLVAYVFIRDRRLRAEVQRLGETRRSGQHD